MNSVNVLILDQSQSDSPTPGTRQRVYWYVCGLCGNELRIWREGQFQMTAQEADNRARKSGWKKTQQYGWAETRCLSLSTS